MGNKLQVQQGMATINWAVEGYNKKMTKCKSMKWQKYFLERNVYSMTQRQQQHSVGRNHMITRNEKTTTPQCKKRTRILEHDNEMWAGSV